MARIALDCRSVFPGMGGIGRYSAMLAASLPKLDSENEYHLIVTERKGEAPLCNVSGCSERRFECGMIDERWEQLELPGELSALDVDLYHNTCFSLPVAGGARHMVSTVHDVIFRRHFELVNERLRTYLDRWTKVSLELADAVITVSEFSKREICDLYGVSPAKIRVVYNGIDERFFLKPTKQSTEVARRKFGLSDKYVLYVGAIEEKKNISRLLAAWRKVVSSKAHGGRKLVLAGGGGGQEYDVKEAIKTAKLTRSVVLPGYIPDENLVAVMGGADLFVYPSMYEGFGLPVLEAMACQVPVVTSKTSSLGEVAGDAALLIDPESVDELAEGMVSVLSNQKLASKLIKNGKARSAVFTPEACASETLAVYQEVLA
jgi:glycosyltransferase involved in cell wall biosynthesis